MITETEPGLAEKAHAEVIRLFELEKTLTAKRTDKLAALGAIQKSGAESFVDGGAGDVEGIAQQVIGLHTEVRVIEESIELARTRRVSALGNKSQVQGAEAESRAAEAEREARQIIEQREVLLQPLRELEETPFTGAIFLAERDGNWCTYQGRPLNESDPFQALRNLPGAAFLIPKSQRLLNEAQRLRAQANAFRGQKIQQDGVLTSPTVTELLQDDVLQDPERLTPAEYAITDWAKACEAQLAQRPGLLQHKRTYKLKWTAGKIDVGYSSIEILNSSTTAGPVVLSLSGRKAA
jgi:hypothetical protein